MKSIKHPKLLKFAYENIVLKILFSAFATPFSDEQVIISDKLRSNKELSETNSVTTKKTLDDRAALAAAPKMLNGLH